jgi:hypothetical protein
MLKILNWLRKTVEISFSYDESVIVTLEYPRVELSRQKIA